MSFFDKMCQDIFFKILNYSTRLNNHAVKIKQIHSIKLINFKWHNVVEKLKFVTIEWSLLDWVRPINNSLIKWIEIYYRKICFDEIHIINSNLQDEVLCRCVLVSYCKKNKIVLKCPENWDHYIFKHLAWE